MFSDLSTHRPILEEAYIVAPPAEDEEPEEDRAQARQVLATGRLSMRLPNGATWELHADTLPAGAVARFREVDVCDNGVAKKAWVLMTEPVEPE